MTLEGFEPADVPARFEAGTPAIVPAIGLGEAVDYLSAIGMDSIHRYERSSRSEPTRCWEGLTVCGSSVQSRRRRERS